MKCSDKIIIAFVFAGSLWSEQPAYIRALIVFIMSLKIISKKGYKWTCECPFCFKVIEVTNSNYKRMQSCWCSSKYLLCIKREEIAYLKNLRESIFHNEYIDLYLSNWWYTKIDKESFDIVSRYTWYKSIKGSIETRKYWKLIKLHRLLLNAPDNKVIDHINHDTSDNTLKNIRICTQEQNSYNKKKKVWKFSSKYKWVTCVWRKFEARIHYEKKIYILWRFDSEIEAALEYNKASIKYHWEYWYINNICKQ